MIWAGSSLVHAWYVELAPQFSFALLHPGDGPRAIVNAISGLLVVLLSEVIRLAFKKAVQQRDQHVIELQVLLREIDHRVKNNFSLLSGLLAAQRRQTPSGPARDTLVLAESSIEGIARANQHLYAGNALTEMVEMREYIAELCQALHEMIGATHAVKA